jgi:hypothetical protein
MIGWRASPVTQSWWCVVRGATVLLAALEGHIFVSLYMAGIVNKLTSGR